MKAAKGAGEREAEPALIADLMALKLSGTCPLCHDARFVCEDHPRLAWPWTQVQLRRPRQAMPDLQRAAHKAGRDFQTAS